MLSLQNNGFEPILMAVLLAPLEVVIDALKFTGLMLMLFNIKIQVLINISATVGYKHG